MDFDLDDAERGARLEKARRRVEAALNLARDTRAGQAERDAALAGARRIVEANRLNPADFDWPGDKPKTPPRSRFRDDLFSRPRSPFFDHTWTPEDIEDVLSAFQRHMREATRAQAEARRRTSDAADAFAYGAAGQTKAMDRVRTDLCVSWLWQQSPPVRVYGDAPAPDGSRRWRIPEVDDREYTDAGVVEVAEARGWGQEDPPNPFAAGSARTRAEEFTRNRNRRVMAFLAHKGFRVMLNADRRTYTTIDRDGRFYFDKHDSTSLYRLARDNGFEQ